MQLLACFPCYIIQFLHLEKMTAFVLKVGSMAEKVVDNEERT